MSTWRELHDDFLQEVVMYVENVKVTPPQVMRYLTRGIQEFQRHVNIVETTKVITPTGGTATTSYLLTYPLGSDIQEIHEVRDVDDYTLLQTSWQQFNEIIERTGSGTDENSWGIGFNEVPFLYSQVRRRGGSDDERWRVNSEEGMVRIYTVWDQNLYRYPALDTDATFTVWYRQRMEPFSAVSPQWAAWFPAANFNTQFTTTGPDPQLERWESAFVAYAVGQYLRPHNVLSGESPFWQQYDQEFRAAIDEAIATREVYSKQLTAPYNRSPFS